MSIRTKLYSLIGGLLLTTLLLIGACSAVLYKEYQSFVQLHEEIIIPISNLKTVSDLFAVNIVDTVHKVNAQTLTPNDGVKSIDHALNEYERLWTPYIGMKHDVNETKNIQKAQELLSKAIIATKTLRQLMDTREMDQLKNFAQRQMYPAIDPFTSAVSDLININLTEANVLFESSKTRLNTTAKILALIVILTLVTASYLAFKIVKRLTSIVEHIATVTDRVTESKNLTWRTNVSGSDELAVISNAFNGLLKGMDNLVSDAKQSTELLDNQAKEVANAATAISNGSINQSEATTAMASTLEQIAVSIAHLSDSAKHVQEQSKHASNLSVTSKEAVSTVLKEISAISQAVLNTESQVATLARQSTDISHIVQLIKDVADQTNLLALNAAIEAARAGEAGRGFAVVADEVRKLAERTAKATTEIDTLTSQIIQSTNKVTATMQQSVAHVRSGETLIDSTTQAINQIETAIHGVLQSASEMAESLNEQQSASNDIAQQVETIAQLSQQNADSSQDSASVAEKLSSEVAILHTQLNAYTATTK